jgi:hypothetical protein
MISVARPVPMTGPGDPSNLIPIRRATTTGTNRMTVKSSPVRIIWELCFIIITGLAYAALLNTRE